jgi:hypothetical protein
MDKLLEISFSIFLLFLTLILQSLATKVAAIVSFSLLGRRGRVKISPRFLYLEGGGRRTLASPGGGQYRTSFFFKFEKAMNT